MLGKDFGIFLSQLSFSPELPGKDNGK